ncbi:MAG: hypothetical protein GF320_22595 [Armatimonadia bacterium]|nr:hypothetical protein [Armatimonadia bacterium]
MRNRNMHRLTGQPGWMRFGYSPGWVGRSASGLGPCAEYLMTGNWPAGMQPPIQGMAASPGAAPGLVSQLTALQQSIENLSGQVAAMDQRLSALEASGKIKEDQQ